MRGEGRGRWGVGCGVGPLYTERWGGRTLVPEDGRPMMGRWLRQGHRDLALGAAGSGAITPRVYGEQRWAEAVP